MSGSSTCVRYKPRISGKWDHSQWKTGACIHIQRSTELRARRASRLIDARGFIINVRHVEFECMCVQIEEGNRSSWRIACTCDSRSLSNSSPYLAPSTNDRLATDSRSRPSRRKSLGQKTRQLEERLGGIENSAKAGITLLVRVRALIASTPGSRSKGENSDFLWEDADT